MTLYLTFFAWISVILGEYEINCGEETVLDTSKLVFSTKNDPYPNLINNGVISDVSPLGKVILAITYRSLGILGLESNITNLYTSIYANNYFKKKDYSF